MTTDAEPQKPTNASIFATLLLSFQPIYDEHDQTIYIIEYVAGSDNPLVYNAIGEPELCDTCNSQLVYDSGDMQCPNEECEDNQ